MADAGLIHGNGLLGKVSAKALLRVRGLITPAQPQRWIRAEEVERIISNMIKVVMAGTVIDLTKELVCVRCVALSHSPLLSF